MRRPSPTRQQGFGLLAFVILSAMLAFSLVVGYSGVLTRTQANQLLSNQQKYLASAKSNIAAFYARNAFQLDKSSMSNPVSIEDVLAGANVHGRSGMQAELSRVLQAPDGTNYRVIALWMPSDTDESNPPDIERFRTTGKFERCANMGAACAPRAFEVFDSTELQRELAKKTIARLQRVALKAQSYFKARTLQDPEKNVSVNYFRKPNGACEVMPLDLGCLDTYTPLAQPGPNGTLTESKVAKHLALSPDEMVSAWGLPIEASNLQDSVTDDSPYTMAFRAANPTGGYFTIKAVQQF